MPSTPMSPDQPPRYCKSRPLPPYSYVPGLAPHPMSDPRGHSFGHVKEVAQSLDPATYRENKTYAYGLDLFNYGFYWEAHEAWEALWHASGRQGTTADFLKGLIKLAAAGVKAREGRAAGVRQHALRAADLFRAVEQSGVELVDAGAFAFGLSLPRLIDAAEQIAARADELAGTGANASRRLPLVL